MYFKDVPIRLRDANSFQLRPRAGKSGGPALFQTLVDHQAQVFSSRDPLSEIGNLLIQILMIELTQHTAPHQVVKRGTIRCAARSSVHWTAHAHFQRIIMPVPERIVALAVESPVLFDPETGGVQPMRRRKLVPPRNPDHRESPK